MHKGDEKQFVEALKRAIEVTGGSAISERALAVWWESLAAYSVEQVEAALEAHIAESVYPPKPADVIARIGQADGRPGPEEAWGIALGARDEDQTVVRTPEIVAAWGACLEILNAGDEIGARRAFLERYAREVADARAEQRPVRWELSPGRDSDLRDRAIREAVQQGRLTRKQATKHLPAPELSSAKGELGSEQADVGDKQAHEHLKHLQAMIAGAICNAPEPQIDKGMAARTSAWAKRRRANAAGT